MFSSLAWFQETEDPARGDEFEGTRRYFPINGLEITKVNDPPATFVERDYSFHSVARYSDQIFIYSTSRRHSADVKTKFAGPEKREMACVEIYDSDRFIH